jgi:hypothetical protein
MDLLYSRYSSPMDLVNRYINHGRFGSFVEGFLKEEYERRKQEAEKENELKLWIAYVHSYSDKNYNEWKKQIFDVGSTTHSGKSDADLTEDGIKSILDSLFTDPKQKE